MKTKIENLGKIDLSKPIDISIPLKNGVENPNCYFAEPVKFETIIHGNFVGSVIEGGSVNYQKLVVTPHGNGTHTECYGHISSEKISLNDCLKEYHFKCQLLSLTPDLNSSGDLVITMKQLVPKLELPISESIVIRTLPNDTDKLTKNYSGKNAAYLEPEVTQYLCREGVNHLLVDLPSVDKEEDGGALLAHKGFWNFPENPRPNATITELVFVQNNISDGHYLLNLQITSLEMDASPSKPVLYKIDD